MEVKTIWSEEIIEPDDILVNDEEVFKWRNFTQFNDKKINVPAQPKITNYFRQIEHNGMDIDD